MCVSNVHMCTMYIHIYVCMYIYMCIEYTWQTYIYTAQKASWNIEGAEPGNQEGPG